MSPKDKLIRQVKKERTRRLHRKEAKAKEALMKSTERKFAGFLKRLRTDLEQVRLDVCNLSVEQYDLALTINDGNRRDYYAVVIRYVFRSIEVLRDRNWPNDMLRLEAKLQAFKEIKSNNKGLTLGTKIPQVKHPNVQNKSSVYSDRQEDRPRRIRQSV